MNKPVLIACEESQAVCKAFRAIGIETYSCDILSSSGGHPEWHIQGDIRDAIKTRDWAAMIAFPPCTYTCSSGLHWNKRVPGRAEKTEEALEFVGWILSRDIPMIAMENPVGCISTRIRKPDQAIQPHQFGEDASKKTCLWLKGLPPLEPTISIPGRMVCCGSVMDAAVGCLSCNGSKKPKLRWGNQTDSGQNRLGPSEDRARIRSMTYPGIAKAMADQWGPIITSI